MKENKYDKNEKSLEELKKELETAQKSYEALREFVKEKEAEESERKRAKLALEKENRKKAIEEKEAELIALIREYIKDYGSYKTCHYTNDNLLQPHLFDLFF